MKKSLKFWTGLLMFLSGALLLLSRFLNHRPAFSPKSVPDQNQEPKKQYKIDSNEALIQNALALAGYGGLMQEIAIAVAKHETGNFTSTLYKQNHNLFGMKMPKVRDTTAVGVHYGFAKYMSNAESVEDFILYLKYFNYPRESSVEDYTALAKEKGYFEDTKENYLKALKKWI